MLTKRVGRALAWLFVVACSTGDDGRVGSSVENLNSSPHLSDFVLYAGQSIVIGGNDSVTGGDVGVATTTTSPPQLTIGSRASVDTTHTIISPSVTLTSLTTVGDIETNTLQQNGATVGTVTSYPTSMPALPVVNAPTSYGSDVNVASHSSATLSAGTYGALNVGGNASITLSGGTYVFQSVTISPHASVSVTSVVNMQVGGIVAIGGNCSIGSSTASDLTISVASSDADGGATPAVSIGPHAGITALVIAPNGTIDIIGTASATGAYIGLNINVGDHATVVFGSGLQPSDAGTDATVDAAHDAAQDAAPTEAGMDAAVEAEAGPTCDPQTCNDGNACNGVETCQNNVCTAGTPPTVDDGNPCTIDSCSAQSGVTHTPASSGTSCGSTNICSGTQTCNGAGSCVQNPPAVVDDGNACTVDACDPQSGVSHTPASSGTSCGSTNLCTGTQTCNGSGACVQNQPITVDDGNPCTIDSCDPQQGALHTPASSGTVCGSSDICAGAFVCNGVGSCTQAPPAVTDDGNPCTVDSCDPQSGVSHTPAVVGTACADNLDKCVGAFTCDSSAACVQGATPIVDDGNACTTDACDPGTGVSHTALPPGASCGSTNICTGTQTCDATTTCIQNAPAVIDDGNVCTIDSCNPLSGVSHTPISGCDPSPTTGNGVFESQASLLGVVIDGSGSALTGATFSVFDIPSTTARSDIQLSAGSDGSFRVRLTTFPTSESPMSPPHHLLLAVDAPNKIRAYRDAYVHPGTAYDFGPIKLVGRDANVTNIGPAGGTATDSLNRITVVIPPGALTTTIPVQVTPFVNRDELPYPLPDSTATMYGMDLAPSGTQFASPVTVKLTNWRSIPTTLTIPVGYVDEVNGAWEHMTTATWNGTAFTFTTNHFSTLDANAAKGGNTGDLLVHYGDGVNPNTSKQICGGSSIGVSNGSVQQTFSLPAYQQRSTPYAVTLNYNSGLAGSRPLTTTGQTFTQSNAVGQTPVTVAMQSSTFSAVCVPRGSGSSGSGAPGTCNAGSCSLGASTAAYGVHSYFGSGTNETDSTLPAGTKSMDVGAWLDLPTDSNGDPIRPSFITQHAVLVSGGGGACISGGGTFGVSDVNGTGQQTTLDGGPVATIDRHVFIHHRHNSPYGAGWAIENLNELYLDPDGDHAMLIHGDAVEEEFRPRPLYRVGPVVIPSTVIRYTAFARDKATGENFLLNDHGVLAKIDASAMTFTTLQSSMTLGSGSVTVQGLAVGYVGSTRHWVYATHDGLRDFDGTTTTLLQSRTATDASIYTQSHVAASSDLAFYTDGDPSHPVVYRTRLSDPSHVVSAITTTAGDQRLNPKGAAASTVQLTDPAGLAIGNDGALYVADRRRNVVLRFGLDSSNEVSASSPVTQLVGNGLSGVLTPPGDRYATRAFAVNQPVFLSTWDDGTLLIQTSFGVAQYNPTSDEAEWLFFDANVNSGSSPLSSLSDLNLLLSGQGAGTMGSLLALGPTSMFENVDNVSIYRFDVSLASKYDPYRTLSTTSGSWFVDDPLTETIEAYDSSGRMTERHRRSGELVLAAQYVADTNAVDKLLDADGNATTFAYNGSGKIASITDARGRTSNLSIDGFGDLASFQEPDSEVHGFTYVGHQMTQKTSPAGDTTAYEYVVGVVTKVTKPNGEFTTFAPPLTQPPTYSSAGLPVHSGSYTDDHGVTHNVVVNQRGDIEQEQWTADSVAYNRQVVYDSLLETPGVEDSGHRNAIFRVSYHTLNGLQEDLITSWDELGRVQGIEDTPSVPDSRVLIVYDNTTGYLSSYRGPEPHGYDTHNIVRDTAGHITRVYVPNPGGIFGPETDYTYNRSDGQPDTVTAHGVTYNLSYDGTTKNLASSIDTSSLGITTTLTRDTYGNVHTINDGQTTWTFDHDANNRLTTATDANSNATSYSYVIQSCGCSEADRLTSIHTPDLPSTLKWALDYWPEGRLKSVTDPDGHETQLSYQATGELNQITDANSHSASMSYDSLGRLASAFDALGRAHTRSYPVPTSSGWSGTSIMSGGPDNTAVTTDFTAPLANGQYQIGLNLFQQKGDPAQVSFYRDATFELSYGMQWDQARRLTRRRDRVGTAISSSTVVPTGRGQFDEAQVSYNLSSSDPVVSDISSTYTSISEDASFTQNADYDDTQANGWNQRLPYVVDALTRDAAGRITKHTRQFRAGNGGFGVDAVPLLGATFNGPQTTYTYSSSNGRVTNFTDADGSHDVFYDTRGLVSKITVASEGDYLFEYDALGRNTKITYPGSLVRTQQYDNEGRLSQRCYDGGSLNRCYGASYDAAGNPTAMSDPEGAYAFQYDELDRLTQSTRTVTSLPDEVENYAYNAIGALKTNASVALDDQRNKLSGGGTADAAVPNSYNSVPITLNSGGRITSLFGNTLAYNLRGRLISVTHPLSGGHTNAEYYGYDAQMRRIGRFGVVDGIASATDLEYFVWDGANLVASVDVTNHVNDSWFYEGVDQPLRISTSGLKYYYELDLAGNVRRLRRTDGSDGGGYRYTAFGQEYPHAGDLQIPAPAIDQRLRWKGRQWSDFAQLYDVRARWWSPALGLFTSIDDLSFLEPNWTLWSWPSENPIRYSDPSGRTVGVGYQNAGAAAWAASAEYNYYSMQNSIEIAGLLYESRGQYYHTTGIIVPGISTNNSSSAEDADWLVPIGARVVGAYHTHGSYNPMTNVCQGAIEKPFSPRDYQGGGRSGGNDFSFLIDFAREIFDTNAIFTVSTPSGHFGIMSAGNETPNYVYNAQFLAPPAVFDQPLVVPAHANSYYYTANFGFSP